MLQSNTIIYWNLRGFSCNLNLILELNQQYYTMLFVLDIKMTQSEPSLQLNQKERRKKNQNNYQGWKWVKWSLGGVAVLGFRLTGRGQPCSV